MKTPLQDHPFWDEISASVTSEMAAQQIPALSLAVLQAGKLLFAQGYGLANLELDVKADERTVYGLASISKTFAATALMMLVADGRCRLDDSIRVYLPEAPASWEPITLRHLLSHTSGLPFQVRLEQYDPCERFIYRLDVTHDEFLPLSMSSTRINDPAAVIPHRAASYSLQDGVLRNADYTAAPWFFASNGIVSSIMDMALWDAALTAGQVLPLSLLQQMWEPANLAGEKIGEFGLAWRVEQYERGKVVSHTGGGPRSSCYHARFLEAQVSIILLANRGGASASDLGKAIVGRFLLSEMRR